MKPKFALRHFLALAGCSLFALSSASAVDYWWDNNGTVAGFGIAGGTWDGTTGSTFLNNDNTGGSAGSPNTLGTSIVTTNADRVFFGTGTSGLLTGTVNITGVVNIGTIGSGSQVAGQVITLSGGTINFAAAGNFSMTNGTNLIVDSQITGASTSLIKDNINITVRLNNANNSYTGATNFSGTLQVTSLANGGQNSSIGASSNAASNLQIGLGNRVGTLTYVGASNSSTDRLFTLGNANGTTLQNAILQSSGDGTLQFTNVGSLAVLGSSTPRNFILGGSNTGENILNPLIADGAGTSVVSVTKADAGRWRLGSTTSSYTGATTVSAGILEVALLANGGSNSSIGASTNAATNLTLANGATFRYVGSTNSTTDRGFTVNGTAAGHGATIESSGTGTLSFDNTVAIGWGTADQTRTLTLGGTNSGANTMGKVIANNGTANTSLSKTGAGTWILDQDNTYDGTTNISGGSLIINGNSSTATGAVTVGASGTIGGIGTVGGSTTISGILSPGQSPGTLTFATDLALNSGSTYLFEGGDLTIVNGILDLNDNWTLSLGSGLFDGGSVVLFEYGSLAASPDLVPTFDLDDLGFTPSGVLTLTDTGSSIVLNGVSAIPEPGAALLGGLGVLLVVRRRR